MNDNLFPGGERGKGGGGGEKESLLLEETIVVSIAGNRFQWPGTDLQIPPKSALGNWPGVAGWREGGILYILMLCQDPFLSQQMCVILPGKAAPPNRERSPTSYSGSARYSPGRIHCLKKRPLS